MSVELGIGLRAGVPSSLDSVDAAASVGLCAALALVLAAFAATTYLTGPRSFARLDREAPLPLVGKEPMKAVYAAVIEVGRPLAAAGVPANAITLASLGVALGASVCFAFGHFGLGALVACVAALLDALDGLVARLTRTQSRFGQMLDTIVDRWVDALLFGGVAVYVRHDVWLLALVLAAMVGSYMVSYASSVLRELRVADARAPMRRAERLTILLGGAAIVPFVATLAPDAPVRVKLAPLVLGLAAIAVRGNLTAVRRLFDAARTPPLERADRPLPADTPVGDRHAPALAPSSQRARHP